MRNWKKILGITLGVVVLTSALGVGAVFAADPPTTTPTPQATFLDKLAARLGITVDALKTAVTGARNDVLDDAVAAGRITPEQKQQIQERQQQRADSGFGFGPGMMGRGRAFGGRVGGFNSGACWGTGPNGPVPPTATPTT
jgi:hypothetical protein